MKLKLKHLDIQTGSSICIINKKDAEMLDLRTGERIKIEKGKNQVTAIIDIANSNVDKSGYISLTNEAFNKLNIKNGSIVKITLVEKPTSLHYIKKKLQGERLKDSEIYEIVKDIVDGKLSDIEITYFVSACYIHEMNMKETVSLTNAIINTGEILKPKSHPVLDKHCIGGVAGNRTTMVAVPILAALGYTMPKTSSRSITSPAGTADAVEVLCPVNLNAKEIQKVIEKEKGCLVWGGGVNMAPADDIIIRVEHPVSLDPVGQLLASIMAKKKSVSASHLLIDIPLGKGAKIDDPKKAKMLKKKFETISKHLNIKTKVVISDGSQPIGNGIGPSLEARDVLWLFERNENRPKDLEIKAIELAAELVALTKKASYKDALKICRELIENGKAHDKFISIIKAQGGKIDHSSKIKLAKYKLDIKAKNSGIVTELNNKKISRIARIAGAPKSKASGLYLHKHIGDTVEKGENIITLYAESSDKLNHAKNFYEKFGGLKVV